MMPKAGLYQKGLLKSLTARAILSLAQKAHAPDPSFLVGRRYLVLPHSVCRPNTYLTPLALEILSAPFMTHSRRSLPSKTRHDLWDEAKEG